MNMGSVERWSYRVLDCFWMKMRRWHRKTLHDRILITISRIAFVVLLVSPWIADADPSNWLPLFIVVVLSSIWLTCFVRANEDILYKV